MTQTAKSPRLSQHIAEPFLEIHPDDASRLGVRPAHLVRVESPQGSALLRALVTNRVQRGEVFAPIHWTSETASAARIGALVAPRVDPVSGQPETKGSVVSVAPFEAAWYGFAVSAGSLDPATEYWARARTATGWRAELAGARSPDDWEAFARALFAAPDARAVTVIDAARAVARIALMDEGRLAALFVSPEPVAVSRSHLVALVGDGAVSALAGRPGDDVPDPGATLCSCFNVGVNTILAAVESQGLVTVEAVGEALQADTNCGSCRPEIAALLTSALRPEAAE